MSKADVARRHRAARASLVGGAALACAVLIAPSARAEERTIGVTEAVRMALDFDPHLRASARRAAGARDLERSARGRLLPAVHIGEEYQHYDSAFAVSFPIPGAPGGAVAFPARKQDTNTFSVAVDQPLTGLLRLGEDMATQARTAEASEAARDVDRARLRSDVQSDYLRLFEAVALAEVAKASEGELAEQVRVATVQVGAGSLTNADLLRTQVALANAKQQEIAATAQSIVARAALLGAIGLPVDDVDARFAEPVDLLVRARASAPAGADARRAALARRPELRQLRAEADGARHQKKSRAYAFLPEVDAEAAYLRFEGQVFVPESSVFAGVKATWAIWEWGASLYAERAASAQEEAARLEVEEQVKGIGVEVAGDLAESAAAASAVDLAEKTIASAEEAFRVTQALLKAGGATTTDLLDAQSALAQARLNRTRAQYEQAMAYVTLSHATGEE